MHSLNRKRYNWMISKRLRTLNVISFISYHFFLMRSENPPKRQVLLPAFEGVHSPAERFHLPM